MATNRRFANEDGLFERDPLCLRTLAGGRGEGARRPFLVEEASEISFSRGQVDELSARVFGWLSDREIGAEDFVLIRLPRDARSFIAMLGVWKAGAAFTVVEDTYAPERIEAIREDCGCRLTIDEAGREVPDGEAEEICFENPFFRGYVHLPEETARVMRDGVFHSGDMGRRLPDGNIVVTGRLNTMVKINGNRVEPGEIEAAGPGEPGHRIWAEVRLSGHSLLRRLRSEGAPIKLRGLRAVHRADALLQPEGPPHGGRGGLLRPHLRHHRDLEDDPLHPPGAGGLLHRGLRARVRPVRRHLPGADRRGHAGVQGHHDNGSEDRLHDLRGGSAPFPKPC